MKGIRMKDKFKSMVIQSYRRNGICSCCRLAPGKQLSRLAKRRLRQWDRRKGDISDYYTNKRDIDDKTIEQ